MKSPLIWCIAAAFLTGCFSTEAERTDLESACAAVVERRTLPRTAEFLEALADRHVARERQLARLAAAEKEDFGNYDAKDDPRFMWALEVECWAELLLLPQPVPPVSAPERTAPVVKKLLAFEQSVLWAKFDEYRKRPASDLEREAVMLALEITTGWSAERIANFDFGSLPRPNPLGRKRRISGADPGREVVMLAAEILMLASQVPVPGEAVIRGKLGELRRARIELARRYLIAAKEKWKNSPGASTLAAWRIARARRDLEKSLTGL